jgi:hypothetical protein
MYMVQIAESLHRVPVSGNFRVEGDRSAKVSEEYSTCQSTMDYHKTGNGIDKMIELVVKYLNC